MIDNLKIKNFKSIGEEEIYIELRPLTIILGPNGSGKSTILESIGLLSQSIEKNTIQTRKETTIKELIKAIRITRTDQDIERLQYMASDIESQRNNNLIDVEDPINVFHKKGPRKPLIIEIGIKLNDEEIATIVSLSPILHQLFIDNKNKIRYIFDYSLENEIAQTILIGDNIIAASKNFITEKSKNSTSWNNFLEFPLVDKYIGSEQKRFSVQETIILDEKSFIPREQLTEKEEYYKLFIRGLIEIIKIIKKHLKNRVFLVSAIRGEIKNKEIDESLNEELLKSLGVGKTGQFLIPVLSMIASRKYEKTYENINKWGKEFLLNKISASWKGKDIYDSDYIENKFNFLLSLSSASQGSRQVLTIITQLFWSDPGSIILIEEPEISLHPNLQKLLPLLFADAISEDRQVIMTTHSEYLPFTLKILLENDKNNKIKKEDIIIYEICKDEKGTKIFNTYELDEKGDIQDLIPGYMLKDQDIVAYYDSHL